MTVTVTDGGGAAEPAGHLPFAASDAIGAVSLSPGAELLTLTLSDDDGGSDVTDAGAQVQR